MTGLILRVKRTHIQTDAAYSECELWRTSDANPTGICLFRKPGIENAKLRIAPGQYEAKRTRSSRFSAMATQKAREKDPNAAEVNVITWEIFGVLDGIRERAGIRIHPVNFAKDLLGCVAFGMRYEDLNKDGNDDLAASREALRVFEQACGKDQEMTVIVTDPA